MTSYHGIHAFITQMTAGCAVLFCGLFEYTLYVGFMRDEWYRHLGRLETSSRQALMLRKSKAKAIERVKTVVVFLSNLAQGLSGSAFLCCRHTHPSPPQIEWNASNSKCEPSFSKKVSACTLLRPTLHKLKERPALPAAAAGAAADWAEICLREWMTKLTRWHTHVWSGLC